MTKIALADMRESWLAWLGVSLAFVTSSFCLALSSMFIMSSLEGKDSGVLKGDAPGQFLADGVMNLLFCSMVSLAVIGTATALVVASRRGAIARLLLTGATPSQVVRFVMTQLVLTVFVCAILGALLSRFAVQPALDYVAADRKTPHVEAVLAPDAMLGGALFTVVLALFGGLRQARAASRILPVEALRQSRDSGTARRSRASVVLRWLVFVVLAAVIVGMVFFFKGAAKEMGRDAPMNLAQMSLASLFLTGLGLAVVAPLIVGPMTRLWTALPVPGAAWHLARHTAIAKSDRLVKSVVPVMFAVGLVFGLVAFAGTMDRSISDSMGIQLEGSSAEAMMSMIALPLAIAVAGSVGSLVMMSRQRDAELALDGVIGATPSQQTVIPVLEALIVTVTATVLGLVMALVSTTFLYVGFRTLMPRAHLVMPFGYLASAIAVCFLVTAAATLLPTLRSLREPAPKVVARLVAE
ncbi:FtsX-like permease family protein [Actinomycetota bacterium]